MRYSALALLFVLPLLCGACGDDAPSPYDQVSGWLDALCEDDPALRADAARSLGKAWPEGARSVPVLAEALEDEDERVREAAAESLEALASRGVEPILAFLGDEKDPQRRGLLKALETIRSLGAMVTPKDLAQYMMEEPRGGLVFMGISMGRRHHELSPTQANRVLLAYLGTCADARRQPSLGIDDPKWPGTAAAVAAFAGVLALGPSETRRVPPVLLATEEADDPVLEQLGTMMRFTWKGDGPVGVVPVEGAEAPTSPADVAERVAALEEADATWQRWLTEGGDTSGPADLVALQVEYGAIFAKTIEDRLSSTHALGAMGPAAKEAVPLLERLVTEGDPTLRYLAARSLRRIRVD